jgi:predicted nucleic acid-binding protein
MYVDTSALAKLYLPEPRSEFCIKAAEGHALFSSSLVLAEFQSTLLLRLTQRSYHLCHREVREARRGDPAGLLRRFTPRNDRWA